MIGSGPGRLFAEASEVIEAQAVQGSQVKDATGQALVSRSWREPLMGFWSGRWVYRPALPIA